MATPLVPDPRQRSPLSVRFDLPPLYHNLGKVCELPGKGVVEFQRVLSFRPVTTRRYYPGTHKVGLRINGADIGEVSFELSQAAGV